MMSSRRGMVSLLLVLLLWPWVVGPPRLFAEGIEELKKGVVKITARVEGQQTKVGTGFIVSAEEDAAYIVTASHVIGSDPQPEVEFFTKPYQTFKAKVIATEGASDNGLAALLVQMKVPKGTVALGLDTTARLSGGEAVSSIGFPRRREAWAVTSGTISGIKNRQITVQAPIEEGNSGGPLLLNGRVVGVVTQSAGTFGQAEPVPSLQLLLNSWRVPMAQVDTEESPSLALPTRPVEVKTVATPIGETEISRVLISKHKGLEEGIHGSRYVDIEHGFEIRWPEGESWLADEQLGRASVQNLGLTLPPTVDIPVAVVYRQTIGGFRPNVNVVVEDGVMVPARQYIEASVQAMRQQGWTVLSSSVDQATDGGFVVYANHLFGTTIYQFARIALHSGRAFVVTASQLPPDDKLSQQLRKEMRSILNSFRVIEER